MTTQGAPGQPGPGEARPSTLVWIDSEEAVIVRLLEGSPRVEHIESAVPPHHRATGHVRHDPAVRHGGGGRAQDAGEPHRLEHLRQFIAQVANRLPRSDNLLILGPGTVHERLAGHLAHRPAQPGHHGEIVREASPPLTDRQLVARLRRFAGVEPRRRSVGAYRSSEPPRDHPARRAPAVPDA
jgi:hypothetical protein